MKCKERYCGLINAKGRPATSLMVAYTYNTVGRHCKASLASVGSSRGVALTQFYFLTSPGRVVGGTPAFLHHHTCTKHNASAPTAHHIATARVWQYYSRGITPSFVGNVHNPETISNFVDSTNGVRGTPITKERLSQLANISHNHKHPSVLSKIRAKLAAPRQRSAVNRLAGPLSGISSAVRQLRELVSKQTWKKGALGIA